MLGQAPTECCFNGFKNERVHGHSFRTREEMKTMAFEYIKVFYNWKRPHSSLGYQSPAGILQNWIDTQNQ